MDEVLACPLTGVRDVEPSARCGVIGLKLQADDVSTAGQLRGHLIAREGSKDRDVRNSVIFDSQEVELRLHIKVIEDEVNPASRLRYDQPDTVHVVAVFLGVVW